MVLSKASCRAYLDLDFGRPQRGGMSARELLSHNLVYHDFS
jgi:hypothetical protein